MTRPPLDRIRAAVTGGACGSATRSAVRGSALPPLSHEFRDNLSDGPETVLLHAETVGAGQGGVTRKILGGFR